MWFLWFFFPTIYFYFLVFGEKLISSCSHDFFFFLYIHVPPDPECRCIILYRYNIYFTFFPFEGKIYLFSALNRKVNTPGLIQLRPHFLLFFLFLYAPRFGSVFPFYVFILSSFFFFFIYLFLHCHSIYLYYFVDFFFSNFVLYYFPAWW